MAGAASLHFAQMLNVTLSKNAICIFLHFPKSPSEAKTVLATNVLENIPISDLRRATKVQPCVLLN